MKQQKNISWIVCKFGGTSVKNKSCWDNILHICNQHLKTPNQNILIVCSAPASVSNKLEKLVTKAIEKNYKNTLEEIIQIYHTLLVAFSLPNNLLYEDFQSLKALCEGITLLQEVSPRIKASILSFGEMMLTKAAFAYLSKETLDIQWADAKILLTSITNPHNAEKHFLSAKCLDENAELEQKLSSLDARIIITQGFIASDENGKTVLLGRGGSDISAAYFAAQLNATFCEIWTDVDGVYSANPHLIPEARLLEQLSYDEAQEISSAGGKVLHPNCIPPLKKHQIPLYIKHTEHYEQQGTLVTSEVDETATNIKSIGLSHNISLISIETVNMWQHAGFLADIFAYFKEYGVSVGLISTSETNITVSLDPIINSYNEKNIKTLMDALKQFGKVRYISPCTAITLIGQHIRSCLHKLSDAFQLFQSQQVYLVSQASNDLNFTFVVDESQAEKLARKLHHTLIETYQPTEEPTTPIVVPIEKQSAWWENKTDKLIQLAETSGACFVYDQSALDENINNLLSCDQVDRLFYAMKANSNHDILKYIHQKNVGFECVSMEEIETVLTLFPDIDRKRVIFTPNFAPKEEYKKILDLNIHLTIDNLYPFQHWGEVFSGKSVSLRIDPGALGGHHKFVCTGGTESKFGITTDQLPELIQLTKKYNITINGLHSHAGSGILKVDTWKTIGTLLTSLLKHFPDVEFIDVGGGLGIVENPNQQPLDLAKLNEHLSLIKTAHPNIELWMEPGRYFVGNIGVLLAQVTQTKQKGEAHFVGINTGMNSLIRPALYGSYHHIVNLSKLDQPTAYHANIVGPICESGDVLGYDRPMPETTEGDILLIATAGAYGHCMSSTYNSREPAKECFLEK